MSVSPIRIEPASRRSKPPSRCMSVLFPTPDAPTTATICPASTNRIELTKHGQRLVAHTKRLAQTGDLDEGHYSRD